MIEITGGLDFIDVDEISFTRTLDRVLGQIIREAAREWLRAVLTSVPARGGFPVLTGAAKSTLAPLGRMLKVAVPVRPVAQKDRTKIIDRRALGEGSQEFRITNAPRGGRAGQQEYEFEWSTDLLHYYINEFYGFIPHAPWHTTDAGSAAFVAYVEEALNRRVPNVADYISVRSPDANG